MKYLQVINANKKDDVYKMLSDYLIELSEFDAEIEFSDGKPVYNDFDKYWQDKKKYPFFLKEDGHISGFVFVKEKADSFYEISKFYLLPLYRNGDNALQFAKLTRKMFDGDLEFFASNKNTKAIKFCNKLAEEFENVEVNTDTKRIYWKIKNDDNCKGGC